MGLIAIGVPKDEYVDEISSILHQVARCNSYEQLEDRIFSVFFYSFGPGEAWEERYIPLARELWSQLQARIGPSERF